MGLYLEIVDGLGKGGGYRLRSDTALIGRSAECDIRLENIKGVSRQHCRVYVIDETLRVQDLGSQNGVVINGRKINDAIIKIGVVFKIGEISLKLRREEAQLVAANVTNTEHAIAENNSAPLVMANPNNHPLDNFDEAQEVLSNTSNKRLLLGLLALVAIVFAGFYLLQMLSLAYKPPMNFFIVKAGQKKVMNLGSNFARAEANEKLGGRFMVRLREYNGLLAESLQEKKLANNPQIPRRRMFEITGDVEGESWINLLNADGEILRRQRVICRGVKKREYPEDIDKNSARNLAMKYAEEGKIFAADKRYYDAWQKYLLAEDLSNNQANEPQQATNCGIEAGTNKNELAKQLMKLFNDALATAFPLDERASKPDYQTAIMLLDQAKILLPDEESIDRQVLENWQLIISDYQRKNTKTKK